METVLEFKNIGVYYPPPFQLFKRKRASEGVWALEDVTFSMNRGDILGLVGHNGAGKSTLLSVINGIIDCDRGTADTFGNTTTLLSLNAGLIPYLSGRKNIFLTGITLGIPRVRIVEFLDEIIAFSELGDFIDKPVEIYSSGMKARLGFSTAMFLRPDILLIDEVLGVGDRSFRKKSAKAIRDKLNEGVTAVVVSHSEATIKEICTRCLWIDHGKSVLYGSPDVVLGEYTRASDQLDLSKLK